MNNKKSKNQLELQTIETEQISIETIILAAVKKNGFDVESMKQLVALKERIDKTASEKEFNIAFAKVQKEMDPVIATKENENTKSKYGAIEDVNAMIMPIATKHGFSISFYQGKPELKTDIRICGDLSHKAGFTKNYWVDLPLDDAGMGGKTNKTKLHGTGSTFTYGQRYLIKLAFNVSIAGEDNDGNGTQVIQMSEKQIKDIEIGVGGHKKLRQLILKAYNVTDCKYVPVEKYEECRRRISTFLDKISEAEGR